MTETVARPPAGGDSLINETVVPQIEHATGSPHSTGPQTRRRRVRKPDSISQNVDEAGGVDDDYLSTNAHAVPISKRHQRRPLVTDGAQVTLTAAGVNTC